MFADVSSEETIRLHKLIKDIKTESDVISALGETDKRFKRVFDVR